MKYLDFTSKYDRFPTVEIDEPILSNIDDIIKTIRETKAKKIVIECYPGTNYKKLNSCLIKALEMKNIVCIDNHAKPIQEINDLFYPFLTDNRVFGKMSDFEIKDLYTQTTINVIQNQFDRSESCLVYGFGASLVQNADLMLYIDLSRWEIQLRYRYEQAPNWNMDNYKEDTLRKYKRGYFIEWRIADKLKVNIFHDIDFYIDGNNPDELKMMTSNSIVNAIKETTERPFRLKPYFDPGVWGGQWMKEVCNLDPSTQNYAWSFDGVPEENSILLQSGDTVLEMPAMNVVLFRPVALLGQSVYNQFGAEFPIRFDFLDTMEGQNLSLQVHPLKSYIKEQFNMDYTQDESYYILDATENSYVYLGVNQDVSPTEFIEALYEAQTSNYFDAEEYSNKIPVKKHDHILIPSGTVHCSGADTMVLEISATPYIFTFKLWDWGRVGLDGLPRPINIKHGEQVIQFDRDTTWVKEHLINQVEVLEEKDSIRIEKTGLHELEFIETVRHWHSNTVTHDTKGTVNVLNLVEGIEAVVESPTNSFKPFIVHYAETFIIPAQVGTYTISPYGQSQGKSIATIKAFVR